VRRPKQPKQKFAPEVFEAIAADLKSGRIPLDRITVSDDVQTGLRAIIRNTGLISFHVNYDSPDGSRPYLKLGDHPGMTVKEARELARVVRALADKGIDPAAGLHARLIRELKEKGERWRP
jgi:hypothetical protein